MNTLELSASAPATLMVAGEHAVLYGYPAIVCAVKQRLTVTLTPRHDNLFTIRSTLGEYTHSLQDVQIVKPFQFITGVIQHFQSQLVYGFNLNVSSDFVHTVGLGSSAAVTVATIAVLTKWLQLELSAEDIFQVGYRVVRQVQQVGSGADIAASVFGGIGLYSPAPFFYRPLHYFPALCAVYTGSKQPTSQVIAKVQQLRRQATEKYDHLFQQIAECTQAMVLAINQQQWEELGLLFNHHYTLQQELGVSNEFIQQLIQQLQALTQIYGAKISGSGLGDCIIGIGELSEHTFPQTPQQKVLGVQQIKVQISSQGVHYA